MATLKFIEKTNSAGEPIKHGSTMVINSEKLIGVSTKSLYIRKGFKNGTLFLSQRGNGSEGAGDIYPIDKDGTIEVGSNLFNRLSVYAEKAGAIIK